MHIPTKPINLPTKLSLSKFGESRSSSHPKADTPGTTVNIIEQAKVDEQEMIKNPKVCFVNYEGFLNSSLIPIIIIIIM